MLPSCKQHRPMLHSPTYYSSHFHPYPCFCSGCTRFLRCSSATFHCTSRCCRHFFFNLTKWSSALRAHHWSDEILKVDSLCCTRPRPPFLHPGSQSRLSRHSPHPLRLCPHAHHFLPPYFSIPCSRIKLLAPMCHNVILRPCPPPGRAHRHGTSHPNRSCGINRGSPFPGLHSRL